MARKIQKTFTLEPELAKFIEDRATAEHRTQSQMLNLLLRDIAQRETPAVDPVPKRSGGRR